VGERGDENMSQILCEGDCVSKGYEGSVAGSLGVFDAPFTRPPGAFVGYIMFQNHD